MYNGKGVFRMNEIPLFSNEYIGYTFNKKLRV